MYALHTECTRTLCGSLLMRNKLWKSACLFDWFHRVESAYSILSYKKNCFKNRTTWMKYQWAFVWGLWPTNTNTVAEFWWFCCMPFCVSVRLFDMFWVVFGHGKPINGLNLRSVTLRLRTNEEMQQRRMMWRERRWQNGIFEESLCVGAKNEDLCLIFF